MSAYNAWLDAPYQVEDYQCVQCGEPVDKPRAACKDCWADYRAEQEGEDE